MSSPSLSSTRITSFGRVNGIALVEGFAKNAEIGDCGIFFLVFFVTGEDDGESLVLRFDFILGALLIGRNDIGLEGGRICGDGAPMEGVGVALNSCDPCEEDSGH